MRFNAKLPGCCLVRRTVPAFDVHTEIEKKNAQLNADKGAAATTITKECRDSIVGETADLNGPYGAQ
ncbi:MULTISPECIES: hypothetical protein [unclassified Massilia]|uniref:hypothetical protein n=1 Tax=unclassified Massilia TaxID=2609279 RepID=UPI00177AF55A|nr:MULTISPECIES: hypothetical protein [unclassified Massilia]MBD8529492.1 hypothetical protein [Massilia sp. CFBP 13647]MBD8672885.1 hypothetical protein [Massilia sp. CFBP 13721]